MTDLTNQKPSNKSHDRLDQSESSYRLLITHEHSEDVGILQQIVNKPTNQRASYTSHARIDQSESSYRLPISHERGEDIGILQQIVRINVEDVIGPDLARPTQAGFA